MNKFVSVGKILNFHGVRGDANVGYSKNQHDFIEKLEDGFVLKDNEFCGKNAAHYS